jgi:hypothetical protein
MLLTSNTTRIVQADPDSRFPEHEGLRCEYCGQRVGEPPARYSFRRRAAQDSETRQYEIKAPPDQLDELEKLFAWVEFCSKAGHSASADVFVDGDGAASFEFGGLQTEYKGEDENSGKDPELHIGLGA